MGFLFVAFLFILLGALLKNSKLDLSFAPDGRVIISGDISPEDFAIIEQNSDVTDFEPDYIFTKAQDSYLFNLTNNQTRATYYGLARISGVNSTNFTYPYEFGYVLYAKRS